MYYVSKSDTAIPVGKENCWFEEPKVRQITSTRDLRLLVTYPLQGDRTVCTFLDPQVALLINIIICTTLDDPKRVRHYFPWHGLL